MSRTVSTDPAFERTVLGEPAHRRFGGGLLALRGTEKSPPAPSVGDLVHSWSCGENPPNRATPGRHALHMSDNTPYRYTNPVAFSSMAVAGNGTGVAVTCRLCRDYRAFTAGTLLSQICTEMMEHYVVEHGHGRSATSP